MKNDEEDDVGCGFEAKHVLNDEDVVVKDDEATNSYEMRITEPSTVHLLNDY